MSAKPGMVEVIPERGGFVSIRLTGLDGGDKVIQMTFNSETALSLAKLLAESVIRADGLPDYADWEMN